MRLFAKSRLAVSVASLALAAAVLLTGCGGDDGGSTGGGSTGGGNTSTTEPEPEPPTPDPDPEPETPIEDSTVYNPGETAETEKSEIAVNTSAENKVEVKNIENDTEHVYAPFNMNLKNTSDEEIDVSEKELPQFISPVATVAARAGAETDYDKLYKEGSSSSNFTITLNGEKMDAVVYVQVYDENGNPQSGTKLKKNWTAEFTIVAKVPAEWAESEDALKVDYAPPFEEEGTTKSFWVTQDGVGAAKLTFELVNSDETSDTKFNDDYMVLRVYTVKNESQKDAELTGALTKDLREQIGIEMGKRLFELSGKDEDSITSQDEMKYMPQVYRETLTKDEYQCTALKVETASGNASCVAVFGDDREEAVVKAGESTMIQVMLYLDAKTNVSVSYNENTVFTVTTAELDKAQDYYANIDEDGYTKIPSFSMNSNHIALQDTLNGQNGVLVGGSFIIYNTTKNSIEIGNTITSLGLMTENPTAQKIFTRGTVSDLFTAVATTTSGKSYNVDVVAMLTGSTDPLEPSAVSGLYLFTFTPTDEDEAWDRVTYYYDGQMMAYLYNTDPSNPSTPDTPAETDIGNGKVYPAIGLLDDSLKEQNVAKYMNIQVGLGGYFDMGTAANGKHYIQALFQIYNYSNDITIPTENGEKAATWQGSYVDAVDSGNFTSKYLQIQEGYNYAAIGFNMGDKDQAYSDLKPVEGGYSYGMLTVIIEVPENWTSINFRYSMPFDTTKYANFVLTTEDDLKKNGSDGGGSGSGDSGSSEPVEETVKMTVKIGHNWRGEDGVWLSKLTAVVTNNTSTTLTSNTTEALLNSQTNGLTTDQKKTIILAEQNQCKWLQIVDYYVTNAGSDANSIVPCTVVSTVEGEKLSIEPGESKEVYIYTVRPETLQQMNFIYDNKIICRMKWN